MKKTFLLSSLIATFVLAFAVDAAAALPGYGDSPLDYVLLAGSSGGGNIFHTIAARMAMVVGDLRKIAYVIAGFGLIAFTWAAIFNKISWKHFANIMMSLFILSVMTPLIEAIIGDWNSNGIPQPVNTTGMNLMKQYVSAEDQYNYTAQEAATWEQMSAQKQCDGNCQSGAGSDSGSFAANSQSGQGNQGGSGQSSSQASSSQQGSSTGQQGANNGGSSSSNTNTSAMNDRMNEQMGKLTGSSTQSNGPLSGSINPSPSSNNSSDPVAATSNFAQRSNENTFNLVSAINSAGNIASAVGNAVSTGEYLVDRVQGGVNQISNGDVLGGIRDIYIGTTGLTSNALNTTATVANNLGLSDTAQAANEANNTSSALAGNTAGTVLNNIDNTNAAIHGTAGRINGLFNTISGIGKH